MYLATMDERMNKIETPHHLKDPLKISRRSSWKGNELFYLINPEAIDYKYWALYYSMYIVKGKLLMLYLSIIRYFTISILQSLEFVSKCIDIFVIT